MNLLQSMNDDLRCELEGHQRDSVKDICAYDQCTASQRLCCSHCKTLLHGNHKLQLVNIQEFTRKMIAQSQILITNMNESDNLTKVNHSFPQKMDRKISERIKQVRDQIYDYLEDVQREASIYIRKMKMGIDQSELNKDIYQLELKIHRLAGRPWTLQTNEQINLMIKIFNRVPYPEMVGEYNFGNSHDIEIIENLLDTVNEKLDFFLKSMVSNIKNIFKEELISPIKTLENDFRFSYCLIKPKKEAYPMDMSMISTTLKQKSNSLSRPESQLRMQHITSPPKQFRGLSNNAMPIVLNNENRVLVSSTKTRHYTKQDDSPIKNKWYAEKDISRRVNSEHAQKEYGRGINPIYSGNINRTFQKQDNMNIIKNHPIHSISPIDYKTISQFEQDQRPLNSTMEYYKNLPHSPLNTIELIRWSKNTISLDKNNQQKGFNNDETLDKNQVIYPNQ